MVELSPVLSRRLRIFPSNRRIVDPKTSSYYRVIASDAMGNLGQNPHGIVFDEVIAQPGRELWDALRTGMGARTQPLMVAATTAGNDETSFAFSEHEYCERVAADASIDPARFVYIRNTPKEADWRDEGTWRHANPALGDYLSIEALREEAREAERIPAAQNRFRQYRLNQWVQQQTRWIDLAAWDANQGPYRLAFGAA
jgi:phage terminase large subunit-like protein